MTIWQLLAVTWNWQPSVLLGCTAVTVGYLATLHFRFSKVVPFFVTGILLLLLASVSPLDTLSHTYLFSAHMLQHLLFVLIVPPLLLEGIPTWLARRTLRWSFVRRTEQMLGQPLVAWLAGAGAMWIWHLPALHNAASESVGIHIAEHMSLLVMGTMFWWPVIAPVTEKRLAPLCAVLYLFSACVACTLLGIILTFAPPGLYPAYLHPHDTLGVLPLLRHSWGLSPAIDQQLGGLLMWVPACLVYLSAIIAVLVRWYGAPEVDILPPVPVGGDHESPVLPQSWRKPHVE